MSQALTDAMANLSAASVMAEVEALIAHTCKPMEILGFLQTGMNRVGRRFELGECAVSDVIAASDIFQEALEVLGLGKSPAKGNRLGTWVIGTVYDGHDLGKNMVCTALRAAGFRVFDLGVRVSGGDFVRAVRQHRPRFVGISCLSSQGFQEMKSTISAIRQVDHHRQIQVLIGGAACDAATAAFVEADLYCRTPGEAVTYCKALRSKWSVISAKPAQTRVS